MNSQLNFLPLTSAISPPFIPSTLDDLRKEFQHKSLTENAVSDEVDPIAQAFRQEKDRALSDVSVLGLAVEREEALPLELRTRANSQTSNAD